MPDAFKREPVRLDSPGRDWAAITPNDSADIPQRPRMIFVTVAGNVACVGNGGGTGVIFPLAVGWHNISPVRIRATGTTATGIIGVW